MINNWENFAGNGRLQQDPFAQIYQNFASHPTPYFTTTATATETVEADAMIESSQEGGSTFDVEFEAPIEHTDSQTMTGIFNDTLSARILRDPDQWYWMLRRWRGT